MRKKLSILGSTGSIGVSSLNVIKKHGDRFDLVGISAHNSSELLRAQIYEHRPKIACIVDEESAEKLKRDSALKNTKIVSGVAGLIEVATAADVDMVVSAIVGSAGLIPTFAAVEAGKDIALANKETLVAAGRIIMRSVAKNDCKLIPIDSEHSAIFQSLTGHRKIDVKRLILTASGGPFLKMGTDELKRVKAKSALNHPTWNMGSKITIDSATLMNKGLEVIEAKWLFDFPPDSIDVIIHPQSIVHSMVEYIDGSVIAQMGLPDMRGPITYALSYPERLTLGTKNLNLEEISRLTFEAPDRQRFPALSLCYKALKKGGTAPAVISAANEIAVDSFLKDEIGFYDIPEILTGVLDSHIVKEPETIEEVLTADLWARKKATYEIRCLRNML